MEDTVERRLSRVKFAIVVAVLMAVAVGAALAQVPARPVVPGSTVTPADYLQWRATFKNWGRWGADDQKGTTNLITPQKVVNATKLVKTGQVISLAHAEPQQVVADTPASAVFHR